LRNFLHDLLGKTHCWTRHTYSDYEVSPGV